MKIIKKGKEGEIKMNATQTEIFLWVVLGIPAIIGIIYAIYYTIWFFYYNTTELIKEIRERRKRKNEKIPIKLSDLENNVGFIGEEDMTLQDKIEKMIKKGWTYGSLAKELGVSKTTISRWHKGENKPSYPYYEEQLDYLLGLLVRKDCQIDNQKIIETRISVDEQIKWHEKALAELKAQKEKDKWKFTEDEKVILRNLDTNYKYIMRDADGFLKLSISKPEKYEDRFLSAWVNDWYPFHYFAHLFQCIQWEDDEPCEFRKYI